MAPPDVRGRLVTLVPALGHGRHPRRLPRRARLRARAATGAGCSASACSPALLPAVGMLRMPQSPRWLVMVGPRLRRARDAGQDPRRPRGRDRRSRSARSRPSSASSPAVGASCATPLIRAALTVGVGLAILQQVTGINTVIYYAPTIVEFTGHRLSSSAILAAVGVGIVNVGMTLVAIRLLDRVGRRVAAARRHRRHGDLAVRARPRLRRHRRGRRSARSLAIGSLMTVRGRVRDQPRADLLADQLRDLPAADAQQGDLARHDRELGLQLHRLADLPDPDRRARRAGAFWLYAGISVLTFDLLPEARARDQGQAPGGDPGSTSASASPSG